MAEPVGLVVQICNDTGKRLLDMNAASFFAARLLTEASSETEHNGDAAGCCLFVQRLVSALPGFADMITLSTRWEPFYLFKKAFLLYLLKARLLKVSFDLRVPDTASPPMFVDKVIPAMLVRYKIIQLGPSASATLVQWGKLAQSTPNATPQGTTNPPPSSDNTPPVESPNLTKEDAYHVRAAALGAGERSVNQGADHLWTVAKDDPELRKVPRLVEKGTVMY